MQFSLILLIHIAAGCIGLVSGAAAVSFKKGSRWHKKAGDTFFFSMMTMAISGAFIAWQKDIVLSVLGGGLTAYLVLTGWLSVRQKVVKASPLNLLITVSGVALSLSYFYFGYVVSNSESGVSKDGLPPAVFWFFGTLTLFAACMDVRMLAGNGLRGAARLVRHLWRMNFALLMATISFFLGQTQVFPDVIRKIQYLGLPVLAVLLVLLYWIMKMGWQQWKQRKPA